MVKEGKGPSNEATKLLLSFIFDGEWRTFYLSSHSANPLLVDIKKKTGFATNGIKMVFSKREARSCVSLSLCSTIPISMFPAKSYCIPVLYLKLLFPFSESLKDVCFKPLSQASETKLGFLERSYNLWKLSQKGIRYQVTAWLMQIVLISLCKIAAVPSEGALSSVITETELCFGAFWVSSADWQDQAGKY